MLFLKKIIRRIKYGVRCDSETYIRYLRSIGVQIGERCTIYAPRFTEIDETRPWMVKIGNDVQITRGVTILTHGYDWSVLKGKYGDVLGSAGSVEIGDNVFIGVNSTILKGVSIGSNVIIGACSFINKDIPDNCVVAGNPIRVLMSIDEYHDKRKEMQLEEATELVQLYRRRFGRDPNAAVLREFFWLFSNNPDSLPNEWKAVNQLVGNEYITNQVMKINEKKFDNMEDFLANIPWPE